MLYNSANPYPRGTATIAAFRPSVLADSCFVKSPGRRSATVRNVSVGPEESARMIFSACVRIGIRAHHRDVSLRKGRDAQFHGNLRSRNSLGAGLWHDAT
jgi:hypothetical protein